MDIDLDTSLSGASSVSAEAWLALPLTLPLDGDSTTGADADVIWTVTSAFLAGSSISGDLTASFRAIFSAPGEAQLGANLTLIPGYQAPIRYQPPCRTSPTGKMILEQVDFFLVDGRTRAQGLVPGDLQLKVFLNDAQVDWPLVSGAGIQNVRVTAGRVYWTEFSSGYYSIRFYPNMAGTWRVIVTYPDQDQAISLSYDVAPQYAPPPSGMRASLLRR